MTTQQIRFFLESARCQNFSEAAKKLYVSQPTISKQIAMMEDEIGISLFRREKNMVKLTAAGGLLLKQLEKIETSLNTAIDHARRLTDAVDGHLEITVLDVIDPNTLLTPVIHRFHSQYPGIEIEVSICGFNALSQRIHAKQTDLVLSKKFHLQTEPGLRGFLTYPVTQSIIMPAGHPLAKKTSVNIQELSGENFIVLELTECPNHINSLVAMCTKEGFYPKISRYASSNMARIYYVSLGWGVTLMDAEVPLPPWANVVAVPFRSPNNAAPTDIGVELAWPADSTNPTVGLFVETAKEFLGLTGDENRPGTEMLSKF